MDADVIVVGAGLAGLVATAELAGAGRRVVLVDQEPLQNLGGQAYWSFGGLFLVDSPEQRRTGVRDSIELAWQDWRGTADFDRPREDRWPERWARAYVDFAAGEKRAWLHSLGVRFFPAVGCARRSAGSRRTSTRASSRPTASPSPACSRRARRPVSGAAACTATARWRAPSSASASSPGGRRAEE